MSRRWGYGLAVVAALGLAGGYAWWFRIRPPMVRARLNHLFAVASRATCTDERENALT
jgi:hypothetical protein